MNDKKRYCILKRTKKANPQTPKFKMLNHTENQAILITTN